MALHGLLYGLLLATTVASAQMPSLPPNATVIEAELGRCASGVIIRYWIDTDGHPETIEWGLLQRGAVTLALWKLDADQQLQEMWARFSERDIRHLTRAEVLSRYPDLCALADAVPTPA